MRRSPYVVAPLFVGIGLVAFVRGGQQPAPGTDAATFRMQQIDDGMSETAALADLNSDGALDIVSAESWYEAPSWTKHAIRTIPFTNNYVDNFSDLPVDVNEDGHVDLVQVEYFNRRLLWVENPGASGGAWREHEIEAIGPTEFAFLVDLNNDGRARELLPEFTGRTNALSWYEIRDGAWIKHVVSDQSYGHGIGAGDVNGDGRTDIVTPQGWLEAPEDLNATDPWAFHATDWLQPTIDIGRAPGAAARPGQEGQPGQAAQAIRVEFGFMNVIDLNEDGRNDILTTMAHSFGILWFEQLADGTWAHHLIDNTWSRSHASTLADVNGDGRLDFVTGTRFMGRNAVETEPLAIYWYEYRPGPDVTWTRHEISTGGEAGAGLQIVAGDIGGDGDLDIVSGGKSGLFLAERLR